MTSNVSKVIIHVQFNGKIHIGYSQWVPISYSNTRILRILWPRAKIRYRLLLGIDLTIHTWTFPAQIPRLNCNSILPSIYSCSAGIRDSKCHIMIGHLNLFSCRKHKFHWIQWNLRIPAREKAQIESRLLNFHRRLLRYEHIWTILWW